MTAPERGLSFSRMSKFSFVIEVKGGKPIGTAFNKEDAQKAKDLFNKLREDGKEAYYFQHPNHDKRCKSAEQMEASRGTESRPEDSKPQAPVEAVDMDAPKPTKKNQIFGI